MATTARSRGWQYDADADGTAESTERYLFMYDERWRMVGSFRVSDDGSTLGVKEAFVSHAAGLAGRGGSYDIDA